MSGLFGLSNRRIQLVGAQLPMRILVGANIAEVRTGFGRERCLQLSSGAPRSRTRRGFSDTPAPGLLYRQSADDRGCRRKPSPVAKTPIRRTEVLSLFLKVLQPRLGPELDQELLFPSCRISW